jgi:hypothetical protein
MRKSKRRTKEKTTLSREFTVESVNGIEIAHTTISTDEKLSGAHLQQILKLSEIATRQFEAEGRGGFLVLSEVNSNQAVYVSAKELFESIKQLIPEALDKVEKTVDEYTPQSQFVVINIVNRKRIAITIESLRLVA